MIQNLNLNDEDMLPFGVEKDLEILNVLRQLPKLDLIICTIQKGEYKILPQGMYE